MKQIELIHPLNNLTFKFYVHDNSTSLDIMKTFNVYVRNFYLQQLKFNNPIKWDDNTRALAKGKSLHEISPLLNDQVLQDITNKYGML